MSTKAWATILCVASAAACGPKTDEGLDVARLPDGTYRLTLKAADLRDVAQGQRLLLPAAVELCGAGEIRFGRHDFQSGGAPPRLVQDLSCAAATSAAAPDAFLPSESDERAVAELSERFLKLRDAGDLTAARTMFDPKASSPPNAAWEAEILAFRRLAGAVTKQAISKISWFENPPAAPAPGVYAAVDYVRAFERVKTACGFVIWRRQPDGRWLIDREKLNYLTPEQEAGVARADLPEARARLGCR
jgi:hypothetical protein